MPSCSNNLKNRQTPIRMPYSCQAQLVTSGSIVWPDGAGMAVRGIGREMSHTSKLMIVHTMTLPPFGSLSGGRSTMAEYGLLSLGIILVLPLRARMCSGPLSIVDSYSRRLCTAECYGRCRPVRVPITCQGASDLFIDPRYGRISITRLDRARLTSPTKAAVSKRGRARRGRPGREASFAFPHPAYPRF